MTPKISTVPTAFSVASMGAMTRKARMIGTCIGLAVACAAAGCGGSTSGDSTKVLSTNEAKHLLLQLPYHYVFRPISVPNGASGALAGKATNGHHVVLQFGVALGRNPDGVSVPRSGTEEIYSYLRGGFVYTDDLMVPTKNKKHRWVANPRFRNVREWHEAGDMEVEMEEKLCEAATGEPCKEW